jgi:two-component system CheB/CheR fusion protein
LILVTFQCENRKSANSRWEKANMPDTGANKGKEPRPLRVLIADDNKNTADSLGMLLTAWGHEPLIVYDGLAALRKAQSEHPDVALLDLGLPGMDGYRVAQQLRRQPALKEITLIAVTGYKWKDAHLRSEEYGFNHHLVKPVEPEQLRGLLATIKPG